MTKDTRTASRFPGRGKGTKSRPRGRAVTPPARAVTREEAALWARTVGGVKPLERPEQRRAAPAETPVEAPALQKPALQKPAAARRPKPAESPSRERSERLPELGPDTAPGLDKRTAARLRRGQLPIEARIDLHGLSRDEAHRALEGFLGSAHDAGKRCVLVITGKGLRASGEMGVLRDAVPRWLNAPPIRPRILAFRPAPPRDGGAGALYVLLKRKR